VSDAPAESGGAKNPDAPRTLRDGERPRRGAPRVAREGVPQASLSEWEPPADDDDDRPILNEGERPAKRERERPEGRRGSRSGASPIAIVDQPPHVEDEVTATESPDFVTGVADTDRPPPKSGGSDEIGPDFQNLFLNIGRRDGVKPADLQRMLVDLGGFTETDIGRIHIRDRIAFVAVKKELADRAIRALVGQVFGGRTISAEPARSRD
jgi:ATP-dependent RNA helicase DeaD